MQTKIVENLQSDSYFDGNDIQIKLQKAILLLPEKQQLVFKMKYFEEIKYENMSEILGTSVGALKASYHHAVKKIEEYMNSN
jgi:RNA polymerase sigma-70 factor (ECF subfamily)